jgi:hypothetical protein
VWIGVTGHRPDRLRSADEEALRARLRDALDALRSAAPAGVRPGRAATLASALAEGTDRIAAEVGLALGYALCAILPFPRDAYEEDFEARASRRHFRSLLARAAEVIELPGARTGRRERIEAYAAAGRALLGEAACLVSVWDREETRRPGGTASVTRIAAESGLPVLWIDARRPHACRGLALDEAGAWREAAPSEVLEALAGRARETPVGRDGGQP